MSKHLPVLVLLMLIQAPNTDVVRNADDGFRAVTRASVARCRVTLT